MILEKWFGDFMNAKQKEEAAALYKLHKQMITTISILDQDMKSAVALWRQDSSNQFYRRTLVRCGCASIEGTLNLLKNVSGQTADFFGIGLSEEDMEIITESRKVIENGKTKTKPKFLPIRDKVKETFRVFTKSHATQINVKYDVPGFQDLCDTFELRHGLMHPKNHLDLEVSDRSVDTVERGMTWFNHVLKEVLNKCNENLPFHRIVS